MSGVGAHVTTLVVRVDGEVKTHQFNKVLVATEAKLVGQVERVVLVLLDGGDLAVLVDIAVDASSNGRKLGDQVHRILKSVLPVVLLVQTLSVSLGEGRLVLKGSDGKRELGHGVEVRRAAVDKLLDELGNIRASSPFGREIADLLFTWNLTS